MRFHFVCVLSLAIAFDARDGYLPWFCPPQSIRAVALAICYAFSLALAKFLLRPFGIKQLHLAFALSFAIAFSMALHMYMLIRMCVFA